MRARVREVIDGVNGCESCVLDVEVEVAVGEDGDVVVGEGIREVAVGVALDIAKTMPFDVAACAAVAVGVVGDSVIVVAGC